MYMEFFKEIAGSYSTKVQAKGLNVSDSAANEIIKDILKQLKQTGTNEIDVIDIHAITKLPVDQISRIMNILEKERVVS